MRNFILCLFAAGSLTRFATFLTLLATAQAQTKYKCNNKSKLTCTAPLVGDLERCVCVRPATDDEDSPAESSSAAGPPGPYVTGGPDYNNQLTNAEWMTGSCQTGREQSPIDFKMVTPVEVIEGDDPSLNNGLNFSE